MECPCCGQELDVFTFFEGECPYCRDDFDPFKNSDEKYGKKVDKQIDA
jgi:protein-disulfide isomerase|tara:strand:- start:293 stop:436 length:144 start_codon:yes stop_codon:yes gene_type:complete